MKEKKIAQVYAGVARKAPTAVIRKQIMTAAPKKPRAKHTRAERAVMGEGAYMQKRKQI